MPEAETEQGVEWWKKKVRRKKSLGCVPFVPGGAVCQGGLVARAHSSALCSAFRTLPGQASLGSVRKHSLVPSVKPALSPC